MRYAGKIFLPFLIIVAFNHASFATADKQDAVASKATAANLYDLSRVFFQVTTHPEIDSYPAISPDGRWLAFASRRSGNMDIWMKPIRGGSAVQITTHRADDIMPTWSPDGKSLVFVSYRDDAAGDLWQVNLKKRGNKFSGAGNPKRLTNYLGIDISPAISPDGNFVAFASDRDGEQNIYVMRLMNKAIFRITEDGGINPTWSPEGKRIAFVSFKNNPAQNGQIFYATISFKSRSVLVAVISQVTTGGSTDAFPFWNPSKDEIFFSRYDHDSNRDGKINPDDKPGLWKIVLEQQNFMQAAKEGEVNSSDPALSNRDAEKYYQEIQLIPTFYHDYFPVCGKDARVYFVSQRSGNDDIWSFPTDGLIPRMDDAFLQYQFSSNLFPLPYSDLFFKLKTDSANAEQLLERLLAFQRVTDFFPRENTWAGWAMFEIARTFVVLGNPRLAQTYFEEILTQFKGYNELLGRTELQLFDLNFDPHPDKINKQTDQLQQIISRFDSYPQISAEAQLSLGEAYFLSNRYAQALKAFEALIDQYPDQPEKCALAQIFIGEIYEKFGQTEEVINAFLRVIQNYPSQEEWVDLALNRILSLEKSQDFYSTISAYQNIIVRYIQYRRLAARSQVKIGEAFFLRKDYDAAIEELSLVAKNYPDQRVEVARAELMIARIFLQQGEELRAINQCQKVIKEFGDVQGGLYVVQAKEELLAIYLESGKRFRSVGEIDVAYSRFREAVKMFPHNIEAHRGMIAAMYSLDLIDQAISTYQNQMSQQPDDEIVRYMLGLCYSYKATEKSDRTKNIENFDVALMKKSNGLIEEALSKNYRLLQAYLTLSYNYEFIEKYESALRMKKQGFFVTAIKTIVAPVQTLVHWLTFQEEKTPRRWFEQGIDALTTAFGLNNENENPLLESELALNLANNYYNLQEFGFERAYYYYHIKLKYDTTFTSSKAAAQVYKQMGHCALVVEDYDRGPIYLKRAIDLYRDLGDNENWLLNIKRLALLYQLSGDYDESVEYFKTAADQDLKAKRYQQLAINYRSIAYNYQLLNDEEEAIKYAQKSLDLIRNGKVSEVKSKPNWIKLGILGVEFPVWNLGQIGAGFSTAAEGFTTDEEIALLYSIIGQAALGQRSISDAISYLDKKKSIYRKRNDKVAEAIFLNNIGYLYYWDFNYARAWDYFERSLRICKKEQNVPGMLINIINLASLGVQINKLQSLPAHFLTDSLQQSLLNEAPKFLDAGMNFVQTGLALYAKEPIGFPGEKVQLFYLLGHLHVLKNWYLPDSLKSNQPISLQRQIDHLEDLAIADSCYRSALEIAQANNLKIDQILAHQNLGNVSFVIGDWRDALDELWTARELAIGQNLFSWLWRIDFKLGQILATHADTSADLSEMKDANSLFNEAIATSEQNALLTRAFRITPFHHYQVRLLFETVIDYLISQGKITEALRLTEHYRGKQYLDFIGSQKLELKKERHKIFLGNARFLIQEITDLDNKIWMAKEKANRTEIEIASWKKQKRNYENEYQKLLDEIKKEDPELESFIRVEPINYTQVQEALNANSTILNYFISDHKIHIWTIASDSVNQVSVPIESDSLEYHVDQLISGIRLNQNFTPSARWLWRCLLAPVADKIYSSSKIIIIPDGAINRIPFSFLINFASGQDSPLKQITTASSLSNYFFSYQERKIRGTKVMWASSNVSTKIEDEGYNVEKLMQDSNDTDVSLSQYKDRLQTADIIYLDMKFDPNNHDPLISKMTARSLKTFPTFRLKDLYGLDLQSSLCIVDGVTGNGASSVQVLERALLYAGTPSIIFSLWQNADNYFWDYLFRALVDYPIAEAFLQAQSKMRQAGFSPASYAGYQLIGFEGMNDDQEQQFAEERFASRVAIGNKYANERAWADAISSYQQALLMAKKQGDVESAGKLFQLIIETAAQGGLYDIAISYQLELVEIAKTNNDTQSMAEGYDYLVYFYTEARNFDQAIYYQNEYLKLARQFDQRKEIANSFRNLGLINERGGNFEKALEYFIQATQAYQEIGDSSGVASCLKNQGRIYLLHLDNYSKAIENQEQALRVFQKQNDLQNSMEVLQNLGLSHERLANYQTALSYQLHAFDLAQKLGDSYWIALSQQYLANVSWKTGNYEQALKYQKQAQQIFEQLNDNKLLAIGFATQGLIFMSLGNLDEAVKYEGQAFELAQKINARQDMATILKNLGLMYRAQNRWDDALEQFQHAIQIDESLGSQSGLSYGYRDVGSIYFQQGKTDEALTYFRRALSISQQILDGRNEVQCLYEIGKTHLFLNQLDVALDTLTLAAGKAEKLFIPEVEWRCRRLIGDLLWKQNKMEQSLAIYHQALSIIETMRAQIKVEEYKSGFIDDKLDVYHDLVNRYIQLDQAARALEIVERAKSRNFIDLLANRDIKFGGKFSEAKLEQGKNFEDAMRRIQNEISQFIMKGEKITVPEQEKLNELNGQLQQYKQQYHQFLIELKEDNSELADMTTVEPPGIDSVQKALPDSVILLEYFYTSDKLYIWAITNNRIIARFRNYRSVDLIAQVGVFRDALQKQMSLVNISQPLYNLLIAPFEAELAQNNHIVIIPHGILHYLPFAALLDNNQKYLIERYSLSLAPSASVLNICMTKGQPFLSQKNWTPNILALGNPDLNNPQLELPFAEKEIESINLIYPNVVSFTNKAATETIFKTSSANPNMILLSCHGEFDAANPLFSTLLLAPDTQNDGRLQAHEIFGLNMDAYLVVMSACETGLAKVAVGDELIGLSRSFIYAGTSSLLSSLWKVDDLATAVMIKRFFRYLKEGDSRARALQKSINFVREQINVHPVYWSAFNLTGDFR